MRQANAPVAKIRKGDDGAASHAQHILKHLERRSCFLQSLAEDHIIETLIGKVGEGFFKIAVKYRNAARDGALRLGSGDLHAARIHMFVGRQPFQKFAFAAAEVEHAGVGFDQFADDGVVAAAEQLAYESFGHAKAPTPLRSRLCKCWPEIHAPAPFVRLRSPGTHRGRSWKVARNTPRRNCDRATRALLPMIGSWDTANLR